MVAEFKPMVPLFSNVEKEKFKLVTFQLTQEELNFEKMRHCIAGTDRDIIGLKADHQYVKLVDKTKREVVMSDTPMEINTNREFISKAHGSVLIGGLGIGMVVLAIQDNPAVTKITIIERESEILEMLLPQLPLNNKVSVLKGDIFSWEPLEGTKYDTIYFDIWNNICADNYPEMKQLHLRYRKFLAKTQEKWMGSWRKEDCKRLFAKDKREEKEERRTEAFFARMRTDQ